MGWAPNWVGVTNGVTAPGPQPPLDRYGGGVA